MVARRLLVVASVIGLGAGFIGSAAAQGGTSLQLVAPRVFYQVARADQLQPPLEGVWEGVGAIEWAGMSLDGETIAWTGVVRGEGTTVYIADWEGKQVNAAALPPELGVRQMEVGQNCAALLLSDRSLWRVQGGVATRLFGSNRQVTWVRVMDAAQDCNTITLVVERGEWAGDVAAIYGQGEPLRVMEREILPCPNILGCQAVWNILDWEDAEEAGRSLVLTDGFWVKNEAGDIVTITEYELQVGATQTWWYVTSDIPLGPLIDYSTISPDGSHIVYSAEVFDGPTSQGYWWIWADANGGLWIPLQPQWANRVDAAMNRDGSLVFLDLGTIEYPQAGRTQGLFPGWNPVFLAASRNLAMTCTDAACRLLFGDTVNVLYRGFYDDLDAWEEAPIQIDDVRWTEGAEPGWYVLTVDTRNSELVPTTVAANPIGAGVLLAEEQFEYSCLSSPVDNGSGVDAAAGDGIFSASCRSRAALGSGAQDGFRIAATVYVRQGVVTVGDFLFPATE